MGVIMVTGYYMLGYSKASLLDSALWLESKLDNIGLLIGAPLK